MILDPAMKAVRKGALAYVGAIALTGDLAGKTFKKFVTRGTAFWCHTVATAGVL